MLAEASGAYIFGFIMIYSWWSWTAVSFGWQGKCPYKRSRTVRGLYVYVRKKGVGLYPGYMFMSVWVSLPEAVSFITCLPVMSLRTILTGHPNHIKRLFRAPVALTTDGISGGKLLWVRVQVAVLVPRKRPHKRLHHVHLRQGRIRLPTLVLKPRGDVTRSPERGINGPIKWQLSTKFFFKKLLTGVWPVVWDTLRTGEQQEGNDLPATIRQHDMIHLQIWQNEVQDKNLTRMEMIFIGTSLKVS